MKVDSKSQVERIGVSATQLQFAKLGWIFREQPISDYGIDAQVEIVENGKATAQLIALQIKSGLSWFSEKTVDGVIYRGDMRHLDYYENHSLPVIIVLYNPSSENCYWQSVNEDTVKRTGKGWKLVVPFNQNIDEVSKNALRKLNGEIIIGNKYTILSFQDISHGLAKRYSANILLNQEMMRIDITTLIRNLTKELKAREYYRNEMVKNHWRGKPAHVVWLFIYSSMEDARNINWICRSQWISESLSEDAAPTRFSGEDIGDGIIVDWNDRYDELAELYRLHTVTKEEYLETMLPILEQTKEIMKRAIGIIDKYKNDSVSEKQYIHQMQKIETLLDNLYLQSIDLEFPPTECSDLDEAFQVIMAAAHGSALPFSDKGLTTWPIKNRNHIVVDAIKDYKNNLARLDFELMKIN